MVSIAHVTEILRCDPDLEAGVVCLPCEEVCTAGGWWPVTVLRLCGSPARISAGGISAGVAGAACEHGELHHRQIFTIISFFPVRVVAAFW